MDQASRGAKALEARDYPTAIKEFTSAILSNPRAVKYYTQRSAAYQRSGDTSSALIDAEIAVKLAVDRASRELIAESQLQRGKVLFAQERYADADLVFDVVKAKNPKEKTVTIWEAKVKAKLKSLEGDDQRKQVTAKEVPDVHVPTEAELKGAEKDGEKGKGKVLASGTSDASTASTPTPAPATTVVPTPPNKIKHDWYQSTTHITLTILAKGVPKDKVIFDLNERSLSLSFPTPNDSTYDFTLDPLFDAIDVSSSTLNVYSTKVEISLRKATPGRKWAALEISSVDLPTTTPSAAALPPGTGPAYPTSSKSGPKDWDKILKKPEGEKDDEDGDPQDFFKLLYAGASEETRRAMMKSYIESNGTALSTNWEEVKKGPVETSPPDGMEARKWDS